MKTVLLDNFIPNFGRSQILDLYGHQSMCFCLQEFVIDSMYLLGWMFIKLYHWIKYTDSAGILLTIRYDF